MLSLLSFLPGIFSTINGITNAISNEKIAALNATTQEEQIAASERVATLQAQRDVLISDLSVSRLDIYLRSLIALGPTSYLLKIFLWDKVIGSFSHCSGTTAPGTCITFDTDPIDPNLWNVIMVIIGFYFLHAVGSSISRAIKS